MINNTFVNFSLGTACNLRCKFCYNDKKRNFEQEFYNKDYIFNSLYEIRKETDFINLIGGEPLLHPDLFEILDYIKKLNFSSIKIVTNGIKLSDIEFVKKLLLNYNISNISISIHSHSNELEDQITQRKNTFDKKIIGINNLLKIKQDLNYKIGLNLNLSINSLNINYLDDIVDFYNSNYKNLPIGLSGLIITNNLSEDNKNMLVKYSDIIKKIDIINNIEGLKFSIHWIPLCIHSKIKNINYKIRELDSKYLKSLKNTGENLLSYHKKYKVKSLKCNNCYAYGKFCFGIYKFYFDNFGDKEFITLNKNDIKNILTK